MARPNLYDTSVIISTMRSKFGSEQLAGIARSSRSVLCAVTSAELQSGVRSPGAAFAVARFVRTFADADRLLAPDSREWEAAGRLIARASARFGRFEPRDHYPDVLIALIAHRIGATIVTDNVDDFERWISFGRLNATITLLRTSNPN